MAIWEEPVAWSTEFLRSQRFNKEIRDKQQFLFKRPRELASIASAGNVTVPTTWSFIDEVGFIVNIETTGRPLLVTILGTVSHSSATANVSLRFDCKVGENFASSRGITTQRTFGAYYVGIPNPLGTSQQYHFEATMYLDWLTIPDIYTIKPMWIASLATTVIPTNNSPLSMIVEEL